ncbi:restriction endonuclease [Frondihabitans sucicola]|uniref:restriction endonuclease n=1 Tax=Frondihabitans sucicola TaxID=1268041 RepID=UPI0033064C21
MVEKVQWRTISREDFERIVNVLITRDGDALGYAASAPSGRGGDGGIDIVFRDKTSGSVVHVFQLKHFPEGFSGAGVTVDASKSRSRSRQRQPWACRTGPWWCQKSLRTPNKSGFRS